MSELTTVTRASENTIFTIVAGTTVPDRAALIRAECREDAAVELRRRRTADADGSFMEVWVECTPVMGVFKAWKKIGHVPGDVAASFQPFADASQMVVAYGNVRSVYAPASEDEAVVTVLLRPRQK
jgi:hypothetical protein